MKDSALERADSKSRYPVLAFGGFDSHPVHSLTPRRCHPTNERTVVKSISIHTQLENGAIPVFARIIMLTRAEVLELAETEVLLGSGGATGEALVVWLTETEATQEEDQAKIEQKFAGMFGAMGIDLDFWNLGSDES